MTKKYLAIGLIILVCTGLVFFNKELSQFDLSWLKQNQSSILSFYRANTFISTLSFFLIYIFVTALSLPFANIMTLMGGVIFGLSKGVLLVSFASTIGATCAFFLSRYLFRDFIKNKWPLKFQKVNEGFEKNGGYYLSTIRLIPMIPFFLVNLLMGLTTIKVRKYYLISQLSMLPATVIYFNFGMQLSKVNKLSDVFSPVILLSLTLLGIFPILVKMLINKNLLRFKTKGDKVIK
ncbi:MAG: putative membrane protein YdjX (TVP38/TMEM64 family) [Thermoproteota archaeon]